MHIRITSIELHLNISRMLVPIFLIVYLLGTTHLDVFHTSFHHEEELVLHTTVEESDPCHRMVYHQDKANGCRHDSHLTARDECNLCDFIPHGDQTLFSTSPSSTRATALFDFNFYKSDLDSHLAVISASRAPPVLA